MCLISIDEPRIHVSIAARSSRLFVLCSRKLEGLLDPLDNRRTTRGSGNDALEWARKNRNDIHYYCVVMLHGL
jgi:hypothetical protein